MNRRHPGFTLIELIVVVAIISVLIALLLPAVQSAREAARRTQCVNNLLQIGMALESYEATHSVLPPGTVDSTRPIIESLSAYQFSWITQILPHLDQKAVYRHLDFHQGIYQPANQTARHVSLSVLMCPSDGNRFRSGFGSNNGSQMPGITDAATSNYVACHNDVEAPIDRDNHGVFYLNSRVRSIEIDDGLSHTIFVGEKRSEGDELGWASGTRATLRNTGTTINQTKLDALDFLPSMMQGPGERATPLPASMPIPPPDGAQPAKPGPVVVGGFGSYHASGANFLFGDGSVHHIRTTVNLGIYRLLGHRDDGQVVGDNQF